MGNGFNTLEFTYFESKKQQGLILTEQHLCPTGKSVAVDRHGNPVTAREGLTQWDRSKGRYRTYLEQQEAIKEYDTSKTMPPYNKRAEAEIDKLISRAARMNLVLSDDPAA